MSSHITQFLDGIANDIVNLNADLALLRSWGAQPELWLRNQIALLMHRRYHPSFIHIGCEVSYQNASNERIDLVVSRGPTYYLEIKIENENSRNRDWLSNDSPLAQDAHKVLQFRVNKTAHRCLIAVAFTTLRMNDLRALYNDALPTSRVLKQANGIAVFATDLDPLV